MEKEAYVNFEIAKMLKEKGFDWECNGYFQIPKLPFGNPEKINKVLNTLPKKWNSYNKECVVYESISIPTHQMAMSWLREKEIIITIDYNTDVELEDEEDKRYGFCVYARPHDIVDYNTYLTYEEAVEAALKYVLEHLL